MASCLLILVHVRSERSFDQFHQQPEEIYRVAMKATVQGDTTFYPFIGFLWGELLNEDVPEVKTLTRLSGGQNLVVKQDPKQFTEKNFFFTDSTFEEVFQLEYVKGNPKRALAEPNRVVVTEETARKYFGDADPMGQVLKVELGPGEVDVRVSGVIKAYPRQSHFHPDFLASMGTVLQAFGNGPQFQSLAANAFYTYLRTDNPRAVQQQLERIYDTHAKPQEKEFMKGVFLQPLTDIHLQSSMIGEIEANGNGLFVYIFLFVAFLTLLIACINYVNLTTALAGNRSKEVGMRKVVGAHRMELIRQFLTESVVIAFLAMGLAWIFAELMRSMIVRWTDLSIEFEYGGNPFFWLVLVGITLFAGLIAGSYPSSGAFAI